MHTTVDGAVRRRISWRLAPALVALLIGAGPAPAGSPEEKKGIDFQLSVAPEDPFDLAHSAKAAPTKKVKAKPGQIIRVTLTGIPTTGYHTYPITQRAPDQAPTQLSTLKIEDKTAELKPLWPISEQPEPAFKKDFKGKFHLEHHRPFVWSQDVLVSPDATPGPKKLRVSIKFQVCDENGCRKLEGSLEADVQVESDDVMRQAVAAIGAGVGGEFQTLAARVLPRLQAATPALQARQAAKDPGIKVVVPPADLVSSGSRSEGAVPTADTGLWALLLAAVAGGILSLLTPCVLPMLPITVSFFLKQSEKEHHRPVMMALVYCLTIVVVLTGGGLLLMGVMRQFIAFWGTQFFLAGLCLLFALSLLGMYEMQLPSWLSNYTVSQEGRGGLVGTVFMALTFTIISFACVGPIYGTFIALASGAQSTGAWIRPVLATLVFSVTFAAPFFFLAVFPALLRKMPKSGSWMNTVKVVMGFIVLAVALKFLRAGELLLAGKADLLTYDLVLGMFVALSLLCGLYLLAFYRLPHDDPSEHVGVPRLLLSFLFLGLAFYMLPNLFHDNSGEKQPRNGTVLAWVDGFILTDRTEGGLPWIGNFNEGLKQAHEQKRLVFVDFTGVD